MSNETDIFYCNCYISADLMYKPPVCKYKASNYCPFSAPVAPLRLEILEKILGMVIMAQQLSCLWSFHTQRTNHCSKSIHNKSLLIYKDEDFS